MKQRKRSVRPLESPDVARNIFVNPVSTFVPLVFLDQILPFESLHHVIGVEVMLGQLSNSAFARYPVLSELTT